MPKEYQYTGEIWHRGWDCPTKFGQDKTGLWWCNSAHGGELTLPSNAEYLILMAQEDGDEETAYAIAVQAGLKESYEPSWMTKARHAGWRPPEP